MTALDIVEKVEKIKRFEEHYGTYMSNLKHDKPQCTDMLDTFVEFTTEYRSLLVQILANTRCNLNIGE